VSGAEARRRFASARLAHLATADASARPHLVPIVFALDGETIYSAVDAKPKRTRALRRPANVRANPAVALLVDHYSEDWSELWWVRADGRARVLEASEPEAGRALGALAERYEPYRLQTPSGPVLAIEVTRWQGWSAGDRR
jgi:PPOX class probable F420-dependent enzyme